MIFATIDLIINYSERKNTSKYLLGCWWVDKTRSIVARGFLTPPILWRPPVLPNPPFFKFCPPPPPPAPSPNQNQTLFLLHCFFDWKFHINTNCYVLTAPICITLKEYCTDIKKKTLQSSTMSLIFKNDLCKRHASAD